MSEQEPKLEEIAATTAITSPFVAIQPNSRESAARLLRQINAHDFITIMRHQSTQENTKEHQKILNQSNTK